MIHMIRFFTSDLLISNFHAIYMLANFIKTLSVFAKREDLLISTPKRPGAQIFRFTRVKLTINPPFKTARALSQLFAVQCHQWEPVRNGQLIRIYKEGNIPSPPFETARALSRLFTVQCHQWEPIWNGQLIRIYKEGNIPPSPIWNCQSTEWTLHFSMWPMRAHSKQSTNKNI